MRTAATAAFVLLFATLAHADDAGTPAPAGDEHHGVQIQLSPSHKNEDAADVIGNLPPDVRARLTGDQVENIMRRSLDARTADVASTIVPASFFATILAIVAAVLLARHRRERVLHETLRAMIEKGVDIPKELLVVNQKPKPNDRRRGVILVAVGVGLSAFLAAVAHDNAWAAGLVPLLIGAGYLVASFLERKEPA